MDTGHEHDQLPLLSEARDDDDEELLVLHDDEDNGGFCAAISTGYSKLVTKVPYLFVILSLVAVGIFGGVSWHFHPIDTFNVEKGFETRGTPINRALRAQRVLIKAVRNGSVLGYMPSGSGNIRRWRPGHRLKRDLSWDTGYTTDQSHNQYTCSHRKIDKLDFSSSPVRLVFESSSGDHIPFKARYMHAICQMEDKFVKPFVTGRNNNTRMHSLPAYISSFLKKKCEELDDGDLAYFSRLLTKCARAYYNTSTILPQCGLFDHRLPNLLNFLVDDKFHGRQNPSSNVLKYTALVFCYYERNLEFYKSSLESANLQNDLIKISGIYIGLDQKFSLFSSYMIQDTQLFFLAMGLIFAVLLIYLRSFVVMLATIVNVLLSFVTAYFVYYFVIQMKFYPFLNMLAGLILIAIGADDVFIFSDTWDQSKKELGENAEIHKILRKTFSHAAISIFVTSLTTAAAFVTNAVSGVVSIRCFGIFAGLCIAINFLYMITWTPAMFVLCEKVSRISCSRQAKEKLVCGCCKTVQNFFSRITHAIFHQALPKLVNKFWFVWLILMSLVGVGAFIVIFVYPKLQLPRSKDLQIFRSNFPIEAWDLYIKDHFAGEEADTKEIQLPFTFVWGIKPVDTGDWFDPDSDTELVMDNAFNFYSRESQLWMKNFCEDLKNQTFVIPSDKSKMCLSDVLEKMCNIVPASILPEKFKKYCTNETLTFPYPPEKLKSIVTELANYLPMYAGQILGKPIYRQSDTNIVAFAMGIDTNLKWSASHDKMKSVYDTINNFLQSHLNSAPTGLKSGFFSGHEYFQLYDMQDSIANGCYMSMWLSLAIAFIVMFVCSLNLLLTIYAMISITLAIAITVGVIVLVGWELNILESVIISMAVGLSIDFTIHYGVAYRLSKHMEPNHRVAEGFQRVGGAVAMAALTTFMAGAAVTPARVLIYMKLGIFLMLVMSSSWLYSTFYFQSLCRIAGPKGSFCQISIPSCFKKKTSSRLVSSNVDDELITF